MKQRILLALNFLFAAGLAQAQVTTTNNSGAGSLRNAVAAAAPGATITFAAGLSGQTILLATNEILLNKNLVIDASALPQGIQIAHAAYQFGSPTARIFLVAANTTVTLKALTLMNGVSLNSSGGAIFNAGTLTLTSCSLIQNTSLASGGAIYNDHGTLTLNQCAIISNVALDAGGIYSVGGTLAINQCTLNQNIAKGAGIFGGSGGAIQAAGGSVTINQSTITGNLAQDNGSGGGNGGGIDNFNNTTALSLFNSILAGNGASSNPNIQGFYTVSGTNLIGGDPLLLPLGNYGGPTLTMPPRTNSPARNAGSDTIAAPPLGFILAVTNLFPTDQRGQPRSYGAHVDIGAVEMQSPIVVTNLANSGAGSLRQAVNDVDPADGEILFASELSGQTVLLTGGEIVITNSAVIDASTLASGLTLSGGNSVEILTVASGCSVVLRGLTLMQGHASGFPGGALYSAPGSTLQISHCTFFGNSALEGGAILNDGPLLMDNCTLSGNSGGYGGALQCRAPTTLINCTIVGNSATSGGGGVFSKGSTLTVNNCIIADNTPAIAGSDIFNQLATLVFVNSNLVGSIFDDRPTAPTTGPAPLTNAPLLAPLASYGGPTQTMPPLTNSPAIDAANNSTTNTSATDQRGYPRLVGANVDLGAVESRPAVVINTNDTGIGSLRDVTLSALPNTRITFTPALSGQTISLSNGELLINRNLAIDASTLPGGVRLNGTSRVLNVTGGATATLDSLTIQNGFDSSQGGGIYNNGVLTLNRCTLFNNGGTGEIFPNLGGGIYNANMLTLNQCTLTGNRANYGGGIYNKFGATLTVNQSTLSENTGEFGASDLFNGGTLTLFNSIVTDSLQGGLSGGGSLTLLGNNLTTGDPMLAGLGNYGGPTPTMPPVSGSPALNAGDDSSAGTFATDQRGGLRWSGSHPEIGSVEVPFVSGQPAHLTGLTRLGNGAVQFSFSNVANASFTALASTNLAWPIGAWSNLGPAVEVSPGSGRFQFSDPEATNNLQRFYRVRSP